MLPKKILICVGTRPNFMKIAPIIRELNTCADKIKYEIVHTEQPYDSNRSDVFFDGLELPLPTYYLGGDTNSPPEKISSLIKRISDICIYNRPDLVMVVGDIDSTLACAIAANKCVVPIVHIESGERSYDRTMPEEINRILVDNLSTYLFCSTENAINNLSFENIDTENAFFFGGREAAVRIVEKLKEILNA